MDVTLASIFEKRCYLFKFAELIKLLFNKYTKKKNNFFSIYRYKLVFAKVSNYALHGNLKKLAKMVKKVQNKLMFNSKYAAICLNRRKWRKIYSNFCKFFEIFLPPFLLNFRLFLFIASNWILMGLHMLMDESKGWLEGCHNKEEKKLSKEKANLAQTCVNI